MVTKGDANGLSTCVACNFQISTCVHAFSRAILTWATKQTEIISSGYKEKHNASLKTTQHEAVAADASEAYQPAHNSPDAGTSR